jgi:hypothetical protein
MQIKNISFALLLTVFFSACSPTDHAYRKPYFDFDSLVNVQIKKIGNSQDSIVKEAMIDGKQDRSSFRVDSARLAQEWDVFRQLDVINKPLYKDRYEVTEGEDTKSNLRVRTYTSKVSSNSKTTSPVTFVRFYFHTNFRNVKKIEAHFQEQNALYFTERNLLLELDDVTGETLIKKYSLNGVQKMILSENVKFSIRGSIRSKAAPVQAQEE